MPTLHICSLAKLHETVEKTGAQQIVTLLSDGTPIKRPESVLPERHLQLITSVMRCDSQSGCARPRQAQRRTRD